MIRNYSIGNMVIYRNTASPYDNYFYRNGISEEIEFYYTSYQPVNYADTGVFSFANNSSYASNTSTATLTGAYTVTPIGTAYPSKNFAMIVYATSGVSTSFANISGWNFIGYIMEPLTSTSFSANLYSQRLNGAKSLAIRMYAASAFCFSQIELNPYRFTYSCLGQQHTA